MYEMDTHSNMARIFFIMKNKKNAELKNKSSKIKIKKKLNFLMKIIFFCCKNNNKNWIKEKHEVCQQHEKCCKIKYKKKLWRNIFQQEIKWGDNYCLNFLIKKAKMWIKQDVNDILLMQNDIFNRQWKKEKLFYFFFLKK